MEPSNPIVKKSVEDGKEMETYQRNAGDAGTVGSVPADKPGSGMTSETVPGEYFPGVAVISGNAPVTTVEL